MANFEKKDKKKRALVEKFEVERNFLKACIKNQTLPQSLRYEYTLKLHNLQKKTSATQLVNRCVLSGRGRGVLKQFKLSRIWVRQLLAKGQLQGITKSSW
jgi:small subunit ribosomal protein S14